MITRSFHGKQISGLAFGMMRLPVVDGKDEHIDEAAAAQMVDYAYANGVNYFDTAWGYHGGSSELVTGRCLSKYPRESFFLASKFPGYDPENMGKVEEIFERQLEKCQTPYFDFYLFHNLYEGNIDGYLDPKNGILDYLLRQKADGRIKHLGFSAHGAQEVIQRFLDAYGPHMEFCQLQINYMDWHFQKGAQKAELLRQAGIPLWVMEPIRGGRLANVSPRMAEEMRRMRPEESPVGMAFRFLQAIPEVVTVLSGMSNMQQLKENIDIWSTDKPLSKEEFDRLTALQDQELHEKTLPCTACSYCTSYCPQNLPIPKLLALFNERTVTGRGFLAEMAVASLPPERRPSSCIACHSCETVCPQQIQIAKAMADFSAVLER